MEVQKKYILKDVFGYNNFQYVIPFYQRTYCWEFKNYEKLIEDAFRYKETRIDHFMGIVILEDKGCYNDIQRYEIIDGQQRLITISLVLKVIHDLIKNQELLKQEINQYLVLKDDVSDRIVLNDENKYIFKNIMHNISSISSKSNLWDAYKKIKEYLTNYYNNNPQSIFDIYEGLQHFFCVKIIVKSNNVDEEDSQEIFENINSTGVALSLADQVKNYLLNVSLNKQEKFYENYWLKLERTFSYENKNLDLNEFLTLFLRSVNPKEKGISTFSNFVNFANTKKFDYASQDEFKEAILKELLQYINRKLENDSKHSRRCLWVIGLQKKNIYCYLNC